MKTQEFPAEILNEPKHGTLAWNAKEKIWSTYRRSGSSLMMVELPAGAFHSRKTFFQHKYLPCYEYRSVVTLAYIVSWRFEARRDVLEPLVGWTVWDLYLGLSLWLEPVFIKEEVSRFYWANAYTTHTAAEIISMMYEANVSAIFGHPDAVTSDWQRNTFCRFDGKRRKLMGSSHEFGSGHIR